MTPFNIVSFASESKKLPKFYLYPIKQKIKNDRYKIFFSLMTDFYFAFMVNNLFVFVSSFQLQSLLSASHLETKSSFDISMLLFPTILFSYFFFSYFFNHGQTYGMHWTKKRIELKSKSFSDSFKWAIRSMIFCFSCGLSYFVQKSLWSKFRDHDYLYADFVTYKESSPINLLEKIEEFENNKVQEVDLKIAA